MRRLVVGLATLLGCLGCRATEQTDNLPGGYVVTRPATSWFKVNGVRERFQRVRIVAPARATSCQLLHQSGSPQLSGAPDATGQVTLSTDEKAPTMTVRCATPAGDVERTVKAAHLYRSWFRGDSVETPQYLYPPLVHVERPDVSAAAVRWASMKDEICQGPFSEMDSPSLVCIRQVFDALQAIDLDTAKSQCTRTARTECREASNVRGVASCSIICE
ncbi:MAG: hypothetical protein Q8R02_24540 [Hyphomonadaceae bacterium]|nr:hypothetical protein [Hyphomonadaceae bacterium]